MAILTLRERAWYAPRRGDRSAHGSILAWTVPGLIAGALAKQVPPDRDPDGIQVPIGLGIAGAFIGGFLASPEDVEAIRGCSAGSLATGGALLLLWGHRQLRGG